MRTAPYDLIASEYYAASHQTSRNFDQTSSHALQPVRARIPPTGLVLDIGAGRGRCNEFLAVNPERVVQLDNSQRMLEVNPREACMLRVLHQAESLPFFNTEFSFVASFLCDPFLGLNFLHEAYRVLAPGGLFVATTPSYEWGAPLRAHLGISTLETRFITREGKVVVPSVLIPHNKLIEMLELAGFEGDKVRVSRHRLPHNVAPISPDIIMPADALRVGVHELDILYLIEAEK